MTRLLNSTIIKVLFTPWTSLLYELWFVIVVKVHLVWVFASCIERSVNTSEVGNQCFSSGGWWLAQKAYREALETLEDKCRRAAFAIKNSVKIRVMLRHHVFCWNAGTLRVGWSCIHHGTKPSICPNLSHRNIWVICTIWHFQNPLEL